MQKTLMGKNKEIFDIEIWEISEALKVIKQRCMRIKQLYKINIFCDSQTSINKLKLLDSKEGQALKTQIYQKTKQLV